MSAHTAGPWTACGAHRGGCICGMVWSEAADVVVASAAPQDDDGDTSVTDRDAIRANARLIAAAPDLLAIAERWAAQDGGAWHPERHAAEKAELMADTQAAIAKATGADA